jgi:hypothetical protein
MHACEQSWAESLEVKSIVRLIEFKVSAKTVTVLAKLSPILEKGHTDAGTKP